MKKFSLKNLKKPNFVDVLIVLCMAGVLLLGIGAYVVPVIIKSGEVTQTDATPITQPVYFTVVVNNISKELSEEFNINEPVYETWSEIRLGKISSTKVSRYIDYFANSVSGKYEKRIVPDKYSLYLTIECEKPLVSDSGLNANGYVLYQGQPLALSGQNFRCTSYIWELNSHEKN